MSFAQQTLTGLPPTNDNKQLPFNGFLYLSRNTSLNDFQDGTRRDSFDAFVSGSAILNKNYVASIRMIYSFDLRNSQNSELADTNFILSHSPTKVFDKVLGIWALSAVAPTSKVSRNVTNLITSVRLSENFIFDSSLLWPKFSASLGLNIGKNFHQFNTATSGRPLTSASTSQVLSIGYNVSDRLNFLTRFTHTSFITYGGIIQEGFDTFQDISYQINDHFTASIGHSNSGSVLAANGVDSNIRLVDENNSTVYIAAVYGW